MGAGRHHAQPEADMTPVLTVLLLAAAVPPSSWITDAGGVFQRGTDGKITAVDLRASWVTDSDMPQLARMPDVKKLDLSLTRLSDRGLRALRPAPGIEELNLSFAEQIGDEGASAIRNWKRLTRLNLRGTKITDATLEMLAGVTSLRSLDIGYAQLTDVGLNNLTSLTNLRELSMGGNKLTDNGLEFLRQLPQIAYLDLAGTQRTDSGLWSITISDPGLEAIASVSDLRELHIGGTALSANGLKKLAALSKLERLSLQGCKRIGHDAEPVLAGFTNLRWLDVHDTGLSQEDIGALQKALPRCQILK
ncbi:MAG TPA: hypothetical protein VHB50_23335 [Bryobacteraceae bacterium]|nr:hypothetical protein [Bryobacteraceae bacterium]